MKLTDQQRSTINLLLRSEDKGDGWRQCATKIYEKLIEPMPRELIEKDSVLLRARLTPAGEVVAEWAC